MNINEKSFFSLQVANDFVNLTALDTRKQFEVNLTRGLAYRQASKWHDANVGYMQTILRDFKVKFREKDRIYFPWNRNRMFELSSRILIKP